MTESSNRALLKILAAAEQQLDLVLDGLQRPGMDQLQVRRQAFEMLLKAVASEALGLMQGNGLSEELRQQVERFATKAAAFDQGSIDVHSHLIEMSEDWVCKSCGADVASDAAIGGVRAETHQVQLVCAGCGGQTPLTRAGDKVFRKVFRRLISPVWNPRANGFIWNES